MPDVASLPSPSAAVPKVARPWLAAVVVAAVLAGACVGPSRTDADFRLKASSTADQVRSAVETASLAASAAREGRASASYLSVMLSEAEDDATSAQGQFDSIQPPDTEADGVRDDLDSILSDAVARLGEARIAAHRGQLDGVAGLADPLRLVADRLDAFSKQQG